MNVIFILKRLMLAISIWLVIYPSFGNHLPSGFVYLSDIDPSISQQLSFSSKDNFVGNPLDGYEGHEVICTKALADRLKKVQASLKKAHPNYSLKILDAYRPARAVEHIKRWARDLTDQKTKAKYYPDIDKKDLLGTFVAAKRSSHSRGSTVDLVIMDEKTGQLDFGPDYFGDYPHINYKGLTQTQKKNREMLRKLMLQHGFKPYDAEFWHFTLKDEPFPKTYFDFKIPNARQGTARAMEITKSSLTLTDRIRHRLIPVQLYMPKPLNNKTALQTKKWPVVIISHGYTVKHTEYSHLAKGLAKQGYFVASIQHDLPNDSPLLKTENLYERRKPLWDRGVDNILFVLNALEQMPFSLNDSHLTLIGHSNGGDISMLFAKRYPDRVQNIISLDSLRMPFPRNPNLRILSLRSSDRQPDPGVVPGKETLKQYKIQVVSIDDAHHIDFCDRGSEALKARVDKAVSRFLKGDSLAALQSI